MKKNILLIALMVLFNLTCFAQHTEQGQLPATTAKEKEFSEWKNVDAGDGLTYEYRIAFNKRKALACYFEIEFKNTSAKPVKVKVKTHYYDRFVKGNFGEEMKETVKPEKVQGFLSVTQGCKADKEKKDQPDIERCLGCDFSYEIITEFK